VNIYDKLNRINCGFLQHNRDQMDVVLDLHKASEPELDFSGTVCVFASSSAIGTTIIGYDCLCQVLLHLVWFVLHEFE